jgi:hypothetical protein
MAYRSNCYTLRLYYYRAVNIFQASAAQKVAFVRRCIQQSCKKDSTQVCKTHSHIHTNAGAHMQWAKEQHTKECNAHGLREAKEKWLSVHVIRAKQGV